MSSYVRLGLVVAVGLLLLGGNVAAGGLPDHTRRVSADGAAEVGDIADMPAKQSRTELYALTETPAGRTSQLVVNPAVAVNYPSASGTLTYYEVGGAFRGHIDATGLLRGFPYQLKLVGKPFCANAWDPPDDWANEQLGPEGFWWHYSGGVQTDPSSKVYNDYEQYDDCGHGDDPLPSPDAGYRRPEVPHDFVPAQTVDWCYEGVIVFYGSFSDGNGNISWDFAADWSYPHAPPEDNRDDHPFVLPNGPYNVRFVLNESAHNPMQYDGPSTAQWRGVLLDDYVTFEIAAPAVGGIAELPEIAQGSGSEMGAPADCSSPSSLPYIALTALAAAVLLTLTAGGWYVRRRCLG